MKKGVFASLVASILLAQSGWGQSFERILYLKGGGYVSASTAGDVNGDGYDDLITNIPDGTGNGHGGSGSIYLGPTPDSIVDIVLVSSPGSRYVFFAGDINGDGYSDVGVKGGDNGVRIYFGSSIMDSLPDIIIQDTLPINYHCYGEEDFNGDGYDDIAISLLDGSQWFTGVYFGGTNMDTTRDVILRGKLWVEPEPTEIVGKNVELGGDINGDGYFDIVTILQDTANHYDTLCIYYGDGIPDNIPDILLQVDGISSYSIAGDVNGDGYSDVVVGCRFANNGVGRTYIFSGGVSFDTAVDVILEGETSQLWFGLEVATAGDVNGDGFDDVLIYAYGKNYLFFGGNPMNAISDWQQPTAGGVLGTVGDLNNDGRAEFFTGKFIRTGALNPPFIEIWRCNVGSEEGENSNPGYKFCAYPNPFVQSTVISYQVPEVRGQKPEVRIQIYDLSGRVIKVFNNLSDNQVTWDAKGVPAGTYLCKLETNSKAYKLRVKKVISIGR